jgi:hypothetical protein
MFRKQWYDYHEYRPMISYYDRMTGSEISRSTPPIQLTFDDFNSDTWDSSCIDDMKPCFIAVQFTHLHINHEGISIGTLIEIIRLLPNLDSLQASFLPVVHLSCLSNEDAEMLLLVSITNKITKVKLNTLDDKEQVHFLMNLCSRMQYLEVGCTTENDMENIIGSVRINNTHILYLCCLCICIHNANEKMIQKIDTIICFERLFDLEKTFRDYSVRRVQNKIFLEWRPSHCYSTYS